ncbi:hypothetical protein [Bradyrhizobium liaoningense]|uniref:hypothetical protein n=1 Tax=Bradyrhizobium liaoningense TaxID=43992 RepID=UPI001BAD04D2|nr:hypothetical protein [Bradyrhizobium liaoningense]MBR0903879.1 hypothetical protein [Bradyrhizobium liaoningense]
MPQTLTRRSLACGAASWIATTGWPDRLSPSTPSVTMKIDPIPAQKFVGFGVSQPSSIPELTEVSRPVLHEMMDLVYRDLNVDILRLWVGSFEDWDLQRMKDEFRSSYLTHDFLSLVSSRCRARLLLAPGRRESPPSEPMEAYGEKIADFINDMQNEAGISFHCTGVANEPEGFSSQQMVSAVISLRRKLDRLGLPNIGIVAPESASASHISAEFVRDLQANSEAWSGLRAIATHSYNMAADDVMAKLAVEKEYWITEVGPCFTEDPPIDEEPGDDRDAATVAGRFLADMNHRATHWIWFIGVGAWPTFPNGGAGHALVRPDGRGGTKILLKYFYLKNLLTAFDRGAVFYACKSSREGSMAWGYGPKPAITAAVAVNPDQTWTLGIVNATGLLRNSIAWYSPESDYEVAVELPWQYDGPLKIVTTDRRGTTSFESMAASAKPNFSLRLRLQPRQLITIRSSRPNHS